MMGITNFTKDITYLALTEVEILTLRYRNNVIGLLVPRNARLQRMAGMTFTKMPTASLLKKIRPKKPQRI